MTSEGTRSLSAIVVGAGPVACLVAIELRKRSFQVSVYEKNPDFRKEQGGRGHSFNLTLTHRGLSSLDDRLVSLFYDNGIPLPQRVIHQSDGTLKYQQYGMKPEHHLLSIPRTQVHRTLLDEAEAAGARFHFGQQCVASDPAEARASFAVNGADIHEESADILIGCDGANSIVRHEMSRRGARMTIAQDYVTDGFVELKMPPAADGSHALLTALRDRRSPESGDHGLHLWPRGDLMLLAQPNVDRTYTVSLFLPLSSPDPDQPSWETVRTPDSVEKVFEEYFPDVIDMVPGLTAGVLAAPPASLKTVRCFPYHHGRSVLIGDSSHTLVPFYGQGINCSFEDTKAFFEILDRSLSDQVGEGAIRNAVAKFTEVRKPPGDAISDLSLAMRAELKEHSGEGSFHARSSLEKQLHLRRPGDFVPLYHMVAFSNVPYDQVVARHERQQAILDTLCERFDVETQTAEIISAYPASDLDLTPERSKQLLDTVTSRITGFQEDLANGKYPASYPPVETTGLREDDIPQFGADPDELMTEIFDKASASGMVHSHPGFMAHIPSGGLFQASVGDFIARTLNRFPGAWAAAPGFVQLESNVIRWFCTALGYGDGSFGYLTTGGSIANFMAIRCALVRAGDEAAQRATIYLSSEAHFSVEKAARMAGIPPERIRVISAGPDYTMNVGELGERIEEDRRDGFVPGCVIATAGTTSTGSIDDLKAVTALCRSQQVWSHMDACFGGFFRLTARGRDLLDGIEEADSIAVDAHKSLFLPHGTSALLVKEKSSLRDTFKVPGAAYVPELAGDGEDADVDFCSYGPELTREFRGLTAWLPIKMHGIRAFERCLDEKLDLADDLAAALAHLDGVEVVQRGRPHLPMVAFQLRAADGTASRRRTERVCELVCARRNVYVATAELPNEGLVVRACILHHKTNKLIIDRLVDDVEWAIKETFREALT